MRGKSLPERTKSRKSVNVNKVSQFITPYRQVIMSRVHPQVMVLNRLAVIGFTVVNNRRKLASTRKKQPHYNQQLHSMTSFTHLPVTQARSQQPFYGNQQMGTFPVGLYAYVTCGVQLL